MKIRARYRAKSDLRVSPGDSAIPTRSRNHEGHGYSKGWRAKGKAGKRKEKRVYRGNTARGNRENIIRLDAGITIRYYIPNASRVTLDRKLTRVLSNFRATAGGNEVAWSYGWIKDNGGISLSRLCNGKVTDEKGEGGS